MKNAFGLLSSIVITAILVSGQAAFAQPSATVSPAVENVEPVIWNQWILTVKEGSSVEKCLNQLKVKKFYVEQVFSLSEIIIFLAPPSSPALTTADFSCALGVELSGQVDITGIAGVSN